MDYCVVNVLSKGRTGAQFSSMLDDKLPCGGVLVFQISSVTLEGPLVGVESCVNINVQRRREASDREEIRGV